MVHPVGQGVSKGHPTHAYVMVPELKTQVSPKVVVSPSQQRPVFGSVGEIVQEPVAISPGPGTQTPPLHVWKVQSATDSPAVVRIPQAVATHMGVPQTGSAQDAPVLS